jgi:RHS repeat-associated protein
LRAIYTYDAWGTGQYASSVQNYSSQGGSYPATDAVGSPDLDFDENGDAINVWQPSSNTAGQYITLNFATPMYADSVAINEGRYSGFVTQVDVWNGSSFDTVWTGTDTAGPYGAFTANFAPTAYTTSRVRIYVDGSGLGGFPAIDSVSLMRHVTTTTGNASATVTKFTLDGWNPAKGGAIGLENVDVWADVESNGDLRTRYLRGDRVDELLGRFEASGSARYWYLTDNLGSVRAVVDDNGAVKDSITYDAYGNITAETNSTYRGRYAWTGREIEAEVGLQYNRARYYDPTIARWTSKDPMGFDAGDSNLYRYARNAPTNATDPSGLTEIRMSFNAFIPKSHGSYGADGRPFNWGLVPGQLPRPGFLTYDWFETDTREDPGQTGTSRLITKAVIDSKKIGKATSSDVNFTKDADPSYKASAIMVTPRDSPRRPVPGHLRNVKKETPTVTGKMDVVNVSATQTNIHVFAKDNDPFYAAIAPYIYIDVTWELTCKNSATGVSLSGRTTSYPAFEGLVNEREMIYGVKPIDTSPSPANLSYTGLEPVIDFGRRPLQGG